MKKNENFVKVLVIELVIAIVILLILFGRLTSKQIKRIQELKVENYILRDEIETMERCNYFSEVPEEAQLVGSNDKYKVYHLDYFIVEKSNSEEMLKPVKGEFVGFGFQNTILYRDAEGEHGLSYILGE